MMYYGIKLYLSLKNKKPITPHQSFENLICEKYARSELSFSTGSLASSQAWKEKKERWIEKISVTQKAKAQISKHLR